MKIIVLGYVQTPKTKFAGDPIFIFRHSNESDVKMDLIPSLFLGIQVNLKNLSSGASSGEGSWLPSSSKAQPWLVFND